MPAPENPYRTAQDAMGATGGGDRYWLREQERELREAEGLTLARLGRAVRQSQVDAAREATLAAEREAERNYERIRETDFPRVYDEGYDDGVVAGRHALSHEIPTTRLLARLGAVVVALDLVRGRSRRLSKRDADLIVQALAIARQTGVDLARAFGRAFVVPEGGDRG